MIFNTRASYGLVAQILHWATAILIFVLLPLGLYMTGLPQASAEDVAEKSWLYSLHKTLGISVLVVAIVRIAWALVQTRPRPLHADRKFESLAAQSVHWCLYIAIVCMPLTGWLHHSASEGFAPIWWPFGQDLPLVPKSTQLADLFGSAHVFTAVLLGLAIALHVAGTLKHVIVDRDATLQRMIPGRGRSETAELPEPYYKRLPAVVAVLIYCLLSAAVVIDFAFIRTAPVPEQVALERDETAASAWLIDKENSRLDIQITQMGNAVSGRFGNWDAVTIFDPDDLAAASIEVEVDISSLSLGGVSEQAKGKNFLNVAEYPVARFVSRNFRHLGGHSYEADGHLTLAGFTRPLRLPFALRIEDRRAHVASEVTIERLAFGIGENGFSKDDQLGFGVLVTISLEADRMPPSGVNSDERSQ